MRIDPEFRGQGLDKFADAEILELIKKKFGDPKAVFSISSLADDTLEKQNLYAKAVKKEKALD